jgi:F0F1-type ATP synthase assembly protein I
MMLDSSDRSRFVRISRVMESDNRSVANWVAASQVGSLLSGPTIVGLVIDWLADCLPWFTVGGIFLGAIASFAYLIRWSNPSQSERETSSNDPNSPS